MSESTLVKMPHCWKSHVAAQMVSLVSDKNGLEVVDKSTNTEKVPFTFLKKQTVLHLHSKIWVDAMCKLETVLCVERLKEAYK